MVPGAPFACALAVVLAGSLWASLAQADNTDRASPSTSIRAGISATASPSLCEARTINYITHTLPQSCLRSSWTGSWPIPSPSVAANATYRSDGTPEMGTAEERPVGAAPSSEIQTADASATPFMSFEDWKEMMLRRAGQDPQEWRSRKPSQQQAFEKSPLDTAHHAGLGEEDEISLNFDDYQGRHDKGPAANNAGRSEEPSNPDETLVYGEGAIHRGKDAGKTCKERFSYASFDAGATILKTAAGAQNARAILVENKDTYMLLECAAPSKYVIVELSDDILIDTVVLANYEFFSSMIRHFRVSVSDRYPVKDERWLELGLFEARNYRDIQPFLVENPQIWAKYVRVEFLTHYGNEYYCPVSLLRVHGSRMLDSWKDSESGREEDAQQVLGRESQKTLIDGDTGLGSVVSPPEEVTGGAPEPADMMTWSRRVGANPFDAWVATCRASETRVDHPPVTASETPGGHTGNQTPRQSSFWGEKQQGPSVPTPKSESSGSKESPPAASSPAAPGSVVALSGNASTVGGIATSASTTASAVVNETNRERSGNATAAAGSKQPSSGPVGGKSRTSGTSGPTAAPPTVQEGFFKAITKRLQQVESNLTLSLKYIEDQSRHVQEALMKGEQKQGAKITQFLDDLNRTVLSELRNVRDQYDQIWQSTVLALESQADRSERDMMALSARLNLLADEVVFQKRMAIVQAVILLSCLFLVIFSRGVPVSSFIPSPPQPGTDSLFDEPPLRHDDVYMDRWRGRPVAHKAANFAQSMPVTGEGAGSASCESPPLSAHLSGNLEANPPEYHSLSPPLTPGLPDQSRSSHIFAPGRELCNMENCAARRSPCLSQVNSRKPLPSLPEHPSSPHES